MSITVRKATEQDLSSVFSLIKEFSIFQKTPDKVSITLQQMKEEKDFFQCLVAETADKKIIGYACFFFTYYSWSGRALFLDDLYVQENYRKNGIGKMLLDEVITFAKSNQCKKLRWQVSKWNENAISFYKSIGAKIDEVEINCDLIF